MTTSPLVRVEMRERTAVLLIDNPPVNTGNLAQRAALHDALGALPGDVDGVVIASAGAHFYAGSDLREFDRELISPQLPEVIERIEGLPVPVVAAVTGLALGGGLELALGCDARIADASAGFAFPEVTFGMLPGAGGTVRAPRLIGLPATIDLVTSARRVGADEAVSLGLVDAVVPAERLIDEAVAYVRTHPECSPARERDIPPATSEEIDAALAAVPERARPNVHQAGRQVVEGAGKDNATALAEERALFHHLRLGTESVNLRYLFFAKQDAAKALRSKEKPRPIRSVGIIGAGTMGSALARTFVRRGVPVTVVDTNADALARLDDAVTGATSIDALSDADLVIEAVFEDMAVKQDLLRAVEPVLLADATIASNTSYLDLDEMGSVLVRPQRFAGLHFFNPPDRNPLVEVVWAATTDDATAATLGKIVATLGKAGIPAGTGDGFVGNRVYSDYRTQVEFLVEEGAGPEQVDAACLDLGLAIGPFAVADMSGLDIAWARRKRLAPTRPPEQRYVEIADRLCEAGRLGRKTGAGWYRYPEGSKRGEADPEVAALIDKCRAEKGIQARKIGGEEIRRRVLGAMAAGAAIVVRDGVARTASDVDVALTEGFAFPKALGGPLRALSRHANGELIALLAEVYASDPAGYAVLEPAARGEVPVDVATLMREVAPTA